MLAFGVFVHAEQGFPGAQDGPGSGECLWLRRPTKLIEARGAQQIASYRERMPKASAPLRERVAALTAIRREEGYLAEYAKSGPNGFRLIENHCPICVAASACVGLCHIELKLFQEVLGGKIQIERTEHIVNGDRRCVYELQPK